MRDESDLICLRVMTTRELTIDLEQLESNPRYINARDTLIAHFPGWAEANADGLRLEAMKSFLHDYVLVNSFPHETPCTTGPGVAHLSGLEIVQNDTR